MEFSEWDYVENELAYFEEFLKMDGEELARREIRYFIKKKIPMYLEMDGKYVPLRIRRYSKKGVKQVAQSDNKENRWPSVRISIDEDVIDFSYG
ncbi:MAG: hypothetical protein GTN38_04145 [Candidatus Aenigmarchaeota archaeon]|nr:hypothetical protein [Candidatus Aenigmarchaeota archaeon]NIP40852.1 hypothetical protein [Candidatus Aenigmarchaeota archaeon]NIQ17966.1 hypothetical protein [Candidatus Aenigmarchaeota archaeon]NIS73555.1 hypothetical protein [Candidatus Aenigmarchaeota archaeon]